MRKAINEEGKRYGKLTVLKRNGTSKDGKDNLDYNPHNNMFIKEEDL